MPTIDGLEVTVYGTRGQITVPHAAATLAHPLLEALKDVDGAPDPLSEQGIGDGVRCLPGIAERVDQVASTGSLFAELGSGWACRPAPWVDREAM